MTRQAARGVRRSRPRRARRTRTARRSSRRRRRTAATATASPARTRFSSRSSRSRTSSARSSRFLDDRLGIDATVYRKQTQNQIVQNLRESYAHGLHSVQPERRVDARTKAPSSRVRGTPVSRTRLLVGLRSPTSSTRAARRVSLPNALPESYVSDTWLYGNVRNGTEPGLSTMSLTGLFYLRNKHGPAPDRSDDRPAASVGDVHRRAATIASRSSRSASRTTSRTSGSR